MKKVRPVSYTHLDVYKRQQIRRLRWYLWKTREFKYGYLGLLTRYDNIMSHITQAGNGNYYALSNVLRSKNKNIKLKIMTSDDFDGYILTIMEKWISLKYKKKSCKGFTLLRGIETNGEFVETKGWRESLGS